MKVTLADISGEVLRETDVYTVIDNKYLNNLTLSKTILHPLQCTSGHSHEGLEEVYIFLNGKGRIQLDDEFISVQSNDVILISAGAFHKVYNDSMDSDVEFTCIFESYER